MSLKRKPLLRFETSERAQLISSSSGGAASMPSANRRKRRSGSKKSSSGRSSSSSSSSRKPRVVKGRVNLRVAGYSGVQKIPPSLLIPFLPTNKLKQAAKRALGASGKRKKTNTTHRRKSRKGSRKGRKKSRK